MAQPVTYNQIAGRSLERLGALSDGVFAIAMTLLVLDLKLPPGLHPTTDGELWRALLGLAPRMFTYVMTFLTLGIFWTGQQTQLSHLEHGDRHLVWIHFTFLAIVSLMPFSTSLLAEHIGLRLALIVYWLNVLALGAVLGAANGYARKHALFRPDVTQQILRAFWRRIAVGQALYAVGAALCLFDPLWSIGFIVLVQLNFAIAPRIPWLREV